MKWRILSSEYLFSDLWFKVRRDRCETAEGKIIEPYYVYEFPTWVAAVAITKEGKVIMERQYRHALGEICLEIPGGCVDDSDPSLEFAIRRELREETGYEFEKLEYLGKISANPSTNNNLMHMFLATGGELTGAQELDQNEEIQLELVSLDELQRYLETNEIVQAMHVSCIFYALKKLGRY